MDNDMMELGNSIMSGEGSNTTLNDANELFSIPDGVQVRICFIISFEYWKLFHFVNFSFAIKQI